MPFNFSHTDFFQSSDEMSLFSAYTESVCSWAGLEAALSSPDYKEISLMYRTRTCNKISTRADCDGFRNTCAFELLASFQKPSLALASLAALVLLRPLLLAPSHFDSST